MVAQPPPMAMPPTSGSSSTDDHSAAADLLDSGSHTNRQPLAAAVLMKRKRTKRPRHPPPSAAASSSGESTTTEEEDMAHCLILLAQGAAGGYAAVDSNPSPSPAPPPAVDSKEPSPAPAPQQQPPARTERYSSRKYTEAAATPDGARAGFYVYECKTCNKCFPTFQALGGHRASHKKPRLATGADEDVVVSATPLTNATSGAGNAKQHSKPPTTTMALTASPPPTPFQPHIDVIAAFPDVTTALSLNTNSVAAAVAVGSGGSKMRVHECSICGAEFASGQALGGHMRRHRPLNAPDRAVTAITTAEANVKKETSAGTINLELDLNLPAPSDEEAVSSTLPPPPPAVMLGLGQFNDGNKAGLVLTASALVGCHY